MIFFSRAEKKNLRMQMYWTDKKHEILYNSSKDHIYFQHDVKENRGVIKCTVIRGLKAGVKINLQLLNTMSNQIQVRVRMSSV